MPAKRGRPPKRVIRARQGIRKATYYSSNLIRRFPRRSPYQIGPMGSPSALTLSGNVGQIMPDEYYCTLKYSTIINHTNVVANQIFKANSLYDPDASHSINHQPYGFDQLGIFYSKYQVLGCRIKIQLLNNSTTIPVFVTYGFSKQIPTVFNDLYFPESPFIKTFSLGTANGNGAHTVNMKSSIKKLMGQTHILQDEQSWGSVGGIGVGSDPANLVYAFCNTITDDNVSNQNLYVRYTVEYKARFFERFFLSPSKTTGGTTGSTGATGASIIIG